MVSDQQIPANDNDLRNYVVPKQPAWLFEVDGETFYSLEEAEALSKRCGKSIYCRPARGRKAANE